MAKISPKNIAEAIYQAIEGKSPSESLEVLKRVVRMLSKRRMLGKSKDVLSALQEIIDKKTGTVRAKVITAKSMGDGEKKKLEEELKERYKAKKVASEYFEKRELLGGMRVEVGDEVLDTTYKNGLQKLEKFLMKK